MLPPPRVLAANSGTNSMVPAPARAYCARPRAGDDHLFLLPIHASLPPLAVRSRPQACLVPATDAASLGDDYRRHGGCRAWDETRGPVLGHREPNR